MGLPVREGEEEEDDDGTVSEAGDWNGTDDGMAVSIIGGGGVSTIAVVSSRIGVGGWAWDCACECVERSRGTVK